VRRVWTAVALTAASAIAPTAQGAGALPLAWKGVDRLAVHCRLAAGPGHDALALSLCDRVRELAAEGAPIPVAVLPPGDPGLVAPRTLVLLADFAIHGEGREPLLLFTLRVQRAGLEPELFGTVPRAVRLASGASAPEVGSTLRTALSEALPWLRPGRPRTYP
jgi:hypothetical protein